MSETLAETFDVGATIAAFANLVLCIMAFVWVFGWEKFRALQVILFVLLIVSAVLGFFVLTATSISAKKKLLYVPFGTAFVVFLVALFYNVANADAATGAICGILIALAVAVVTTDAFLLTFPESL